MMKTQGETKVRKRGGETTQEGLGGREADGHVK